MEHPVAPRPPDVSVDRGSGFGKGYAELGKALIALMGCAHTGLGLVKLAIHGEAGEALLGISSMALMLRWGGRVAIHQMVSARSSAVIGAMFA